MGSASNGRPTADHVDYCLHLIGLRVWKECCQLIALDRGDWSEIGPKWNLPVEIPTDDESLRLAAMEPIKLTAWQYEQEHPGTDIREVLSLRRDLAAEVSDRS